MERPPDQHDADVLELYRWAVQDPETHAAVLRIMYERSRPGGHATVLREDFGGTCAEAVAWVAMGRDRRAVAIDLDGPTLHWAKRRAERLLGNRAGAISFIEGDSLRVAPDAAVPQADIISVLNFSILYLREPESLHAYLAHARTSLAPDGILVLNAFGGPAAVRPGIDRHRVTPAPRLACEPPIAPFDYQWEVRRWDPRSRAIECAIHFTVDISGLAREIPSAFTYHWRLWSPHELITACRAAGFSNAEVWRHTYDPSKEGSGVFLGPTSVTTVESLDQWTAYIVATR